MLSSGLDTRTVGALLKTMSRLPKWSHRRDAFFFQIYGQSKTGTAVGRACFRNSAHNAKGRSVGRQIPPGPAKARVVSRDGRDGRLLVVVQDPDSEPILVICTHDDLPLDHDRRRTALADTVTEAAAPLSAKGANG